MIEWYGVFRLDCGLEVDGGWGIGCDKLGTLVGFNLRMDLSEIALKKGGGGGLRFRSWCCLRSF